MTFTYRTFCSGTLQAGAQHAVACFDERNVTSKDNRAACGADISATIHADPMSVAFERGGVRRLTPTECERLQGFPDGYTTVPFKGKPMADGPRYRMLGNSMAVNVMRWIGERIALVDELALAGATP